MSSVGSRRSAPVPRCSAAWRCPERDGPGRAVGAGNGALTLPAQPFRTARAYAVSRPLRWRGGRVAEGGGLLNRYTGYTVSWVRIPSPPPTLRKIASNISTLGRGESLYP